MSSDAELTKMAAAALLKEAVLGATRASIAGPSGWKKQNRCAPNKAFLKNTLRGVISSNQLRDRKIISRSKEKRHAHEARLKEENKYKKQYLSATTKSPKKQSVSSRPDTSSATEDRLAPMTSPMKGKEQKPNTNLSKKQTQSLVWTDDDCLELKPVTKRLREEDRKEKSLQKARKMFRSLKFVPSSNLGLMTPSKP